MPNFTTPITRSNLTGWHVATLAFHYDALHADIICVVDSGGESEEYTVQIEKNDVTQRWPKRIARNQVGEIAKHHDDGAPWDSFKAAVLAGQVKPVDIEAWLTANGLDPETFATP